MPARQWHVTLGFFAADPDIDGRAAWLTERVTDLPAPRVRLTGSGRFDRVGWLGVRASAEFAGLATAAGAGERFHPHLTIARWQPGAESDADVLLDALAGYSGPWWTPHEVVLMRGHLREPGAEYPVVGSARLAGEH